MDATGLSAQARQIITERGITVSDYIAGRFTDGVWHGDTCGCTDDRCQGGYHHDTGERCGCLASELDDHLHDRQAADLWRRHHAGEDVSAEIGAWAKYYGHVHVARVSIEGIDVGRPYANPGFVGAHDLPEGGHWFSGWRVDAPPPYDGRPAPLRGEAAAAAKPSPWWELDRE